MGASAGTGMQVRRFAEGGDTGSSTGATQAAPQRAIYRPQYTDYSAGLGATPQAGYLSSQLGIGQPGTFTPQMPTFTRPQAAPPQAQYSIPYRTAPDSSFRGLMGSFGRISKNLSSQQAQTRIGEGLQRDNLTEAQYNRMMSDPGMYLPYVQYVQAGNDPSGFQRAPTPNQFMTTAQQQAYNDKIKAELDSLIRPITYFEPTDQGGS